MIGALVGTLSLGFLSMFLSYHVGALRRRVKKLEDHVLPIASMDTGKSYSRPSHIDEVVWNGLSQAMKRVVGSRKDA
jgi:hypothetical protein